MPVSNVRAVTVDFTNVKDPSQYNPKHIEPGEYVGRVKSVEQVEAKADGSPMWVFGISLDDVPGAVYPYYVKLEFDGERSQAWKLRMILTAAGFNVAKKAIKIDPNKVVGRPVGVEIEEDEYQGRIKGSVRRFLPVSEVAGPGATVTDEDDEDETPPAKAPAKRTRRKAAPEPVEDDDDADEDDEDEAPAPPVKRTRRKAAPAPVEEEDDEDEEAPAPKRRTRKPAAKPVAPADEDDDELDLDLDEI